ncbi:hypothetical protein SEA_ACOLYTE_85 [Mycobacterium phage Acolyte]|nr:hypothetical protein SEA_ACOLYTE_85 [Mycobacterium phage Acolyte]
MEYTPPPLLAVSRLVMITGPRESRDLDSYHTSIEDAREAAITLVAGKGWHFTTDDRRTRFAAGLETGEILWDEEINHVGAVYAYELAEPIIQPTVKF